MSKKNISVPQCKPGSRVLIIGGSGGIGNAVIKMLGSSDDIVLGIHGTCGNDYSEDAFHHYLYGTLDSESDCQDLIDRFIRITGGLDVLLNLAGGIHFSGHWMDMNERDYLKDINLNLNIPFFLSKIAMKFMLDHNAWGRIILTGTESALHGGSALSFPYAIAKRGTECMVQGLAREGAKKNILVNGVRMGFITSGFHQRWHSKTKDDMKERASLVPLKRGGTPDEVAAMMIYLMSEHSNFITGQMIPITGGDWL